jgi:hypothetical protein
MVRVLPDMICEPSRTQRGYSPDIQRPGTEGVSSRDGTGSGQKSSELIEPVRTGLMEPVRPEPGLIRSTCHLTGSNRFESPYKTVKNTARSVRSGLSHPGLKRPFLRCLWLRLSLLI